MFCESAQKNCEYLGTVERLRQDALLAQATDAEGIDQREAVEVQRVATEWIEDKNECEDERCEIVTEAVVCALVTEARERI